MSFYDDGEENWRKNAKNVLTALIITSAIALGAEGLHEYNLSKNMPTNNEPGIEQDSEINIEESYSELEEETTDKSVKVATDETEPEKTTEVETEKTTETEEVVPEQTGEAAEEKEEAKESPAETQKETEAETDSEEITDNLQERATYLADFYAKTGAHTPTHGVYSSEAMEKIIKIMNGTYKAQDMAEAKYNMDYLIDYYVATLNSEKYKDKVNEFMNGEGDNITSIDYHLDLTDIILDSQNYKAYIVVDYLDSVHQKVMLSNSKKEVKSLCKDFFECLANLTYGQGFSFNDINYTIEELKGIENNGLGSILEQCVFDMIPFTYGMDDVEYIDKDGNRDLVTIYKLTDMFNYQGSYYTDWENNLMSSMTK